MDQIFAKIPIHNMFACSHDRAGKHFEHGAAPSFLAESLALGSLRVPDLPGRFPPVGSVISMPGTGRIMCRRTPRSEGTPPVTGTSAAIGCPDLVSTTRLRLPLSTSL